MKTKLNTYMHALHQPKKTQTHTTHQNRYKWPAKKHKINPFSL